MDQKNDKKPGAPIPTLKETLRPQLKIKGLQSGQSLVERLKNFKKKDLAFILAGLGVLFMAPLAEHFLMSPEAGDAGTLGAGWNNKGNGGLGQGGSPFEPGMGGLAPGGAAGGGSDVITPLNVRDPSALVMGPGAQQQAPAVASTPAPAAPAAPSSGGSSDWKDALSQSAAKAGSAAVKKAALPVPKVPLSNGGLRGLGVAGGGGGGSYSLGPVQGAQFGGGGRGDSTGLSKASRDFRGAATRGAGSANAGGFEQLKKNAAAAGSDISRAGSAMANLEQAAGRSMGEGRDGGGGGGSSPTGDKAASGSQDKGSKQVGESLEFLRLKQEQEKAIDLKWEKIKKQEMFPIELRQKVMETMLMDGIIKPLTTVPGNYIKNFGASAGGSQKYVCSDGATFNKGEVDANSPCSGGDNGQAKTPCKRSSDGAILDIGSGPPHTGCQIKDGDAAASGPRNTTGDVSGASGQGTTDQGQRLPDKDGQCPQGQQAYGVFTRDMGVYQVVCRPAGSGNGNTSQVPASAASLNAACATFMKPIEGTYQQGGITDRLNTTLAKVKPAASALAGSLAVLDTARTASACNPTLKPVAGADGQARDVKQGLTVASQQAARGFDIMNAATKDIGTALTKLQTEAINKNVTTGVPQKITAFDKTGAGQSVDQVKTAAQTAAQAIEQAKQKLAQVTETVDTAQPENALNSPGKPFKSAKDALDTVKQNLNAVGDEAKKVTPGIEEELNSLAQAIDTDPNAQGNDKAAQLSANVKSWSKAIADARKELGVTQIASGDYVPETNGLYGNYNSRWNQLKTVVVDDAPKNGPNGQDVGVVRETLYVTRMAERFVKGETKGEVPDSQAYKTTSVTAYAKDVQTLLQDVQDCPDCATNADKAPIKAKWETAKTGYEPIKKGMTDGITLVNERVSRAASTNAFLKGKVANEAPPATNNGPTYRGFVNDSTQGGTGSNPSN